MSKNTINLTKPQTYVGGLPHEQFDWLRKNSPYYKHPLPGNKFFWAITGYDDVYQMNRDHERFSSTKVLFPNHGCPVEKTAEDKPKGNASPNKKKSSPSARMMINMDPPNHTQYRRLVSKDFTPNGVREWDEKIAHMSKDIIDNVIDKGECEFVSEVSGALAGRVIAKLLGLPEEDGNLLYDFTMLFHAMPGEISPQDHKSRSKKLSDYLKEVIRVKREKDTGDLSCKFLYGKVNNEYLSDEDFFKQFALMVNGGTDTARNVIAVGLYELLKNPDQLAWLLEDLDNRMPSAREELLRYTSPVIYQCRKATHDMEFNGNSIKKGDLMALYFGSANFDSNKFDDPYALNLARENNKHVAFGGGHHVCIGQWLARIEIDVMFKEILSRLKNIQVVGEPTWLESNFLFGFKEMNITFDKA